MIRKKLPGLDTSWFWERFFYRHHRALGAIIVINAIYGLAVLLSLDDAAAIVTALGLPSDPSISIILVQVIRVLLLLGLLLALPFGVVVFIRPSLLKRLERHANREL